MRHFGQNGPKRLFWPILVDFWSGFDLAKFDQFVGILAEWWPWRIWSNLTKFDQICRMSGRYWSNLVKTTKLVIFDQGRFYGIFDQKSLYSRGILANFDEVIFEPFWFKIGSLTRSLWLGSTAAPLRGAAGPYEYELALTFLGRSKPGPRGLLDLSRVWSRFQDLTDQFDKFDQKWSFWSGSVRKV